MAKTRSELLIGSDLSIFKPFYVICPVKLSVSLLRVVDAFAKLRKATISFAMSVCPSVCMELLGSHWMDFHEI
jgi:hypothetical protein